MFLDPWTRAGPRYLQLARALTQAILDGRCAAATRLPATRVLARELALSRNTVLAAYEQLAAEGSSKDALVQDATLPRSRR